MFSVVIPLYNKEKYILRAVESVLSQSFTNFELLIVDDGSVDDSLKAIKNISDSRIKIIKQANQGVGAARTKGMAEAKYDWIAFLDADDAWSIDHLNELTKTINTSPSLGMVATKIIQINTNLNIPITDKNERNDIRVIDYFLEASKDINIVHSSAVAISKEAFNNVGGFSDEKMGEDLKYWAKIALFYPVATSDRVTAYYFRGTGGIMESESLTGQKHPNIASLRDLSPSIKMLIEEAIGNPTILKKDNIRTYINSRVYSGVVGATFRENFALGKTYAKLALPQKRTRYMFLKLYQVTPTLILRATKAGHDKYIKR